MDKLIFLKPVFKEMIWGGNRLKTEFGYEIPSEKTGECWAVSAHKNGDCEVMTEPYCQMKLSELWDTHRELFGNMQGDRFPLLIKIIDAKNDLSIQVHPDDKYAAEHENGSLGKTECWYVLDCDENAKIVIGHKAKDKKEVKDMILNKRWDEFIREVPVHKGDFFQIEPGCLHAIKGGTLILETQQNSDVTYRVYDYDRMSGGKKRELHVQQSIDVINAPFTESFDDRIKEQRGDSEFETLVSCKFYTVKKITVNGNAEFNNKHKFVNVSITEGNGTVNGERVCKGNHFIIPYGVDKVKVSGKMELIISYAE